MRPLAETRQVLDALASTGDTKPSVLLERIGREAARIVPECVGVSLGMLSSGLTFTLVATDDEIAAIDAMQYVDGGPCVDSAKDDTLIQIDDFDVMDENRWALFARASAAAGIASTLSLPLHQCDEMVGSVNLYASTVNAFAGKHRVLAAALDAGAVIAIENADLCFDSRRRAAEAPRRLEDLRVIEAAAALLADNDGVDVATAAARLSEAAARAGISEALVARTMLSANPPDEAASREPVDDHTDDG